MIIRLRDHLLRETNNIIVNTFYNGNITINFNISYL